jgi:hypothetical protein
MLHMISCAIGLFTALTATALLAASPASFSNAAAGAPPAPWKIVGLPERYAKPITQFDIVEIEGTRALRVKSDKSWGSLAYPMSEAVKQGAMLRWRWRLDQPLAVSDLKSKATEDGALKVCLSFDMPADNIPGGERALFKLAQFFTKDKIPTATLCYLWGGKEEIGYQQASLFTARVRFIVLANESTPLKTWASKERNIYTDFLKAFGQEAGTVPALSAIVIGADADNTQGSSSGYVGDVQLIQP